VLTRFQDEDGFVGYRSPLLADLGLPHVFTTRRGGASAPALGLETLDERARERVARAAGLRGARLVFVRQVHGADVLRLEARELPAEDDEADALVSARDDVLIGVHVADCVPVLLARADGRRVAAVHAGWRGLVAGVIPRALEHLAPGPIFAAIGPCLSRAFFEVGPEVVAAFERAELASTIHAVPGRRAHIDLRAAAARQLAAGGVERIDLSERCTYADGDELYSYRRDVTHGGGERTGRLAALIAAGSNVQPELSPSRE
jgi:hypothetical protein